jgi:hypothetical protein
MPAMPTVALASAPTTLPVAEVEITARALRSARDGDVGAVAHALRSLPDPSARARISGVIVDKLVADNPRTAARLALGLAGELENPSGIDVAGRGLVRRDAEYALPWAAELPPTAAGRRMARVIVDEHVAVDPRAAIDRIRALPSEAVRNDLLLLAAAAWARRDPDAAMGWLRDLPDDEFRRKLTSTMGFEIAQMRPERAVEIAEMLPVGRDRWLLFSAIAQTWVATDAKAALAWAGRLPAGEPRDAALAGIDTGFGVPVTRRIAGAPGTRRGSSRTRGGIAAVVTLPDISSPAFAAWLATQPAGMSRDEAILEYVRQRGALEPAAIGPLIESLSPGNTRDQASRIYVEGLLLRSPMEAARWVHSLPRSERSDDLIEQTARRWLLTDPDGAIEWIEQSNLAFDRKERLRREAGR